MKPPFALKRVSLIPAITFSGMYLWLYFHRLLHSARSKRPHTILIALFTFCLSVNHPKTSLPGQIAILDDTLYLKWM